MLTVNLEKGTYVESDPFAIEVNEMLKKYRIPVLFSTYYDNSWSQTYVSSLEDVGKTKEILKEKRFEIIKAFMNIAKDRKRKFGGWPETQQWENSIAKSVYSFEISCMELVVRNSKHEICETLAKQLDVRPKYIFCHSANESDYQTLPGYRLYYDEHEKLLAVSEETKKKVHKMCNQILQKNDQTGFCAKYPVQLLFCDGVTHPDSLYGFSRED